MEYIMTMLGGKSKAGQSNVFTKIPKSLFDDPRLIGNDILVYGAIDYFANSAGDAWPSLASIAAKAHISRRSIIRSLKRLEEFGYISKNRRRKEGNLEFDSSAYHLFFRSAENAIKTGVVSQGHHHSVTQSPQVVSEWHCNEIQLNEKDAERDSLKNSLSGAAKSSQKIGRGEVETETGTETRFSPEGKESTLRAIEYFCSIRTSGEICQSTKAPCSKQP
jgi:hypothetical protein